MKRYSNKVIFLLPIVLFVTGSSNYSYAGYSYYHSSEKTFPAKGADCHFRIMTSIPGPEYEEIGIISLNNGGLCYDPMCMKEKSAVEVCKSGGDLLIVTLNNVGQYISGTVFRKKTAAK